MVPIQKVCLFFVLVTLCHLSLYGQNQRLSSQAGFDSRDVLPHTIIVKFSPSHFIKELSKNSDGGLENEIFKKIGVKKQQKIFSSHKPPQLKKEASVSRMSALHTDLSLIYRLEIDSSADVREAIKRLKAHPSVIYAEPAYRYKPLAYEPADPAAVTGGAQYYLQTIKAFDAWEVEKGDSLLTIGIVDYGFYLAHEDLKDNIQYNLADPIDGLDNDEDGYTDNYGGWDMAENDNNLNDNPLHGNFVAGIASARAENARGMAGAGLRCKFLPVKIYSSATGVFAGFEGLLYAAEKGCKVINLSWGRRGEPSFFEEEIINYVAFNYDVVIVSAAGNDGNDGRFFPASYEHVISIAATDGNDIRWGGSNFNSEVDISAPGVGIYSTWDQYTPYISSGGTSFAAPQVSAAAAILRSKYPYLSAAEVREQLIETCDTIDHKNPAERGKLGRGRLNMYRALTETSHKTGPVPIQAGAELCIGGSVRFSPQGGTNFSLYADSTLKSLIGRGSDFILTGIEKTTTYYITNSDSVFESKAKAFLIRVNPIKAAFELSSDTLGLFEKDSLLLRGESEGAIAYHWDFGDGKESNEAHPAHMYTNPGLYTIKLVASNTAGCTDSLFRQVLVVKGIKSPVPFLADQAICKGDIVTLAPGNGDHFSLYSHLPLDQPLSVGKSFSVGPLEKDTVFYLTGADFLFESDPYAVHVKVEDHDTDFIMSEDTVDLAQSEDLQLTDKSQGAARWLWRFGDGAESTEQHPLHRYENAGEFTLTLFTESSLGCRDSLSRKVSVIRTVTTGIERQSDASLRVYPNPTQGMLYVNTGAGGKEISIQVFSGLGKCVLAIKTANQTPVLNLHSYEKGVYYVKVLTAKGAVTRKVILL